MLYIQKSYNCSLSLSYKRTEHEQCNQGIAETVLDQTRTCKACTCCISKAPTSLLLPEMPKYRLRSRSCAVVLAPRVEEDLLVIK